MGPCIVGGCPRRSGKRGRGVCEVHYKAAYRRVRKGEATWAELEAAGLVLASKQAHKVRSLHPTEGPTPEVGTSPGRYRKNRRVVRSPRGLD